MAEKNEKTRKVRDYLEYGDMDFSVPYQKDRPVCTTAGELLDLLTEDVVQAVDNLQEANETQQELLEDIMERNEEGLSLDEFLAREYQDRESREYLVEGAILTCTNSKRDMRMIMDEVKGREYDWGDEELPTEKGPDSTKVYRKLVVTSDKGGSVDDKKYATVRDCVADENILGFGNCDRGPDNPAEMEKLRRYHDKMDGIFVRAEGTCLQLMKLEKEWENYIIDGEYQTFGDDNQSGITMTSMLFCKHGGFIYPVKSGQEMVEVQEMTREKAMGILRDYLSKASYTEEEAEEAVLFLAEQSNYVLPIYKSALYPDRDYNQYDDYILGWTEYYNENAGIEINPLYIKAMCYIESKVGYSPDRVPTDNCKNDIMQALDIKNSNIYDYTDISVDDFEAKVTGDIYWSGRDIWEENWGEGTSPGHYNAEKKERCGAIIETFFRENKDGTGNHYYKDSGGIFYLYFDAVTPNISIAFGMDKMRILLDQYGGNYYNALVDYNKSSDADGYARNVIGLAERTTDENNEIGLD